MDSTAAIAIGLTVGLVVLVFILLSFFIIRRKMVRRRKGKISPSGISPKIKSHGSSSSSLRSSTPIPKRSETESSDQNSEKSKEKGQKELKPSYEGSENRADSIKTSTQKIYPQLTPSDSPGPPIGDRSPRSSQDIQHRDNVTPTASSQHLHEGIHHPQPQHPQLIVEGASTTDEEVPPYYMQKLPPIPLTDSPSPPPSPDRNPIRKGYAPDEDNPGPYPPAQPAQKSRLSRSVRQRSPMRGGRGSRSSSSNS
ncbi:14862_t:CDS:1 [Acaulospora morrowiae]|uniref:14862_t:CDS:1 n=1 Tax=Acaulospora morrowiae TaxID=94023 RepID=A0A9N9C2E6_9GLOM|nr:14862_t:CDS:1 [Acaulospora morrowiae]